ncbi:MAG: carboxymuconolactone decarboxylase family protein [Fluviicoccus sp.]|uniref:carboxymuconolactone decarboxylase family protein n=1 Tax=Fluviicoccus sp. TaxID=2003552 RepID=UPI00271B85D3|nr:carboxymuconolactone decarboxylase family protein [Fluviicoccus sp.]MDO8330627.1 carboxymuconolactone decarboxylase family protein [Fluviicoccus sp.]
MTTPVDKQLTPPGGWRIPSRPRISLPDQRSANPWRKLQIGLIKQIGRLDAANLWLLMMKNPRIMRGMLSFASTMMPFGELDRRDTELCILRVGWNCRARYEWGQHVDIGMRAGLTAEEIAGISRGPEAEGWDQRQAALLQACDEMHKERMISDSTWKMLNAHFSERLLLEILMLIGFYEGLAGVLNSVGIPLDAALEGKLSSAPIHPR